jgi:hypothetical protein
MAKRNELASSTKSNKIIYWVSTIWLAFGMLSSGIVQLLQVWYFRPVDRKIISVNL